MLLGQSTDLGMLYLSDIEKYNTYALIHDQRQKRRIWTQLFNSDFTSISTHINEKKSFFSLMYDPFNALATFPHLRLDPFGLPTVTGSSDYNFQSLFAFNGWKYRPMEIFNHILFLVTYHAS